MRRSICGRWRWCRDAIQAAHGTSTGTLHTWGTIAPGPPAKRTLVRIRALIFAAIVLAAILATTACGGPDAADVAVDEFCDELKYLIREQRLARVDDQQFVEAYGDLLKSLAASEERIGRPLVSAAATKCPTAWNDTERIQTEVQLDTETRIASLHQQLKRPTQTENVSDAREEVTSSPSPAMSAKPKEHILFYANSHVDQERGLYVLSTNSGEVARFELNVTKGNTDKVEAIGFYSSDWHLSSDKRYLAVSRGLIIDDGNDRSEKGLFSIDLSNLTMERLSEPPANCNDHYPLWSPIGNRLLFEEICEGGEGGIRKLGVMDIAQGARTYINKTNIGINISRHDFEFSPDGNTIIGFFSYTNDGTFTGKIVRSVLTYDFADQRWQVTSVQDSNGILSNKLAQLKSMSKISTFISATSHNVVGDRSMGGANFGDHSLSPDGNSLAVRGSISDSREGFLQEFVSILDVRTGNIEKMVFLDGDESGTRYRYLDGKPSWSPDGRLIAIGVGHKLADAHHAYIVDVESESIRLLPGGAGFRYGAVNNVIEGIAWSQDSTQLLVGGCASNCDRGDSKNSIRIIHVPSGEYRTLSPGTEGQMHGLQWLSEADQTLPTATPTSIATLPPAETATHRATPTPLSSAIDGKSVDELRAIVHDEFGKITLSLAEVFVHHDSEQQRPLAIESMLDAIDSCLLSKEAIEQLGVVDLSYDLWPRVAENVGRYCDHLIAASESLIDWNLIEFTQSISNAMSALADAAADVPRL